MDGNEAFGSMVSTAIHNNSDVVDVARKVGDSDGFDSKRSSKGGNSPGWNRRLM